MQTGLVKKRLNIFKKSIWHVQNGHLTTRVSSSGGELGDPTTWKICLSPHVPPPLFWSRNTDFVLFMQFLANLPKLSPTSRPHLGNSGNKGWPDSPPILMKVLVTIGLNRSSSLHTPSWHFTLYSFLFSLRGFESIPDNGKSRNLHSFYFFSRNAKR